MQGLAEALRHWVGNLGHVLEGIDEGRLYA